GSTQLLMCDSVPSVRPAAWIELIAEVSSKLSTSGTVTWAGGGGGTASVLPTMNAEVCSCSGSCPGPSILTGLPDSQSMETRTINRREPQSVRTGTLARWYGML